mmetsp:Transcript_5054/g.6866  ORF Transcript_5054/g.6866 Transcript_5054/m.6866 type:complete len:275 (+) Transcript_5054:340-1164(+)
MMEAPSEGSYSRTSVQNIILVFLVLISCFLYSGLIFGWAPFVLLLKEEGFFTSDCSPSETICASQANQFNFIYTLASTTVSITGLPAGIILDNFGPLVTTCIAVHVVRSNFFLGTVNLLLENLGDASNGYEVTEAVGYIIPCGFLAIPIIGLSVTLFGSLLTFQFINLMGMIYGAMSVVKILKLQLATAAVYTIYRAFFFSTLSTYNAEIFGKRTLGRIQGILFLVSGLLNLCIIPVVKFTTTTLNGDLFWPNLSQLFFLVPLMILTEVERFRR